MCVPSTSTWSIDGILTQTIWANQCLLSCRIQVAICFRRKWVWSVRSMETSPSLSGKKDFGPQFIYLPAYLFIYPIHPIHPSTETYPFFFPYLAISLQPERLQQHAASPVPWLCTTSQNCDRAGGKRKTRSPKHEYQYVLYLLCHYVILYLLFININIYMYTYIYR